MRNRITFLVLILASACGGAVEPTLGDDFGSFNGARIEIVASGGFAGLSIVDRVSHDDRAYSHAQRQICDKACPAPSDSVSGTLAANATDSLFNIVLGKAGGLKDDYGLTGNAADMFAYTVRISTMSATKTIRADDGTMPPQLHEIVQAVRGTISAARK